MGQSSAGFAPGTSFSAMPLNAGTISPMMRRTPERMIYTPPAKERSRRNAQTTQFVVVSVPTLSKSPRCWKPAYAGFEANSAAEIPAGTAPKRPRPTATPVIIRNMIIIVRPMETVLSRRKISRLENWSFSVLFSRSDAKSLPTIPESQYPTPPK